MRLLAHTPVEEFHVVLLDVRGRLIRTERVAQGSVSQCPVSPRDTLRVAVREGAHGVVFVHNHPSGFMRTSPLRGTPREERTPPCGSGRDRCA
jgi:DNA repair protein RadC